MNLKKYNRFFQQFQSIFDFIRTLIDCFFFFCKLTKTQQIKRPYIQNWIFKKKYDEILFEMI